MTKFKYIGMCNCGGVRNDKYQFENYLIYVIRKHKKFHVKHINNYLLKYSTFNDVCALLTSRGIDVSFESLSLDLDLTWSTQNTK